MNFGLIPYDGLQEKDFVFERKKQQFLPGTPSTKCKIRIGFPQWNRNEWVGLFPSKLKDAEKLTYYAAVFNSVELNATHYKLYPEDFINRWCEKVKNTDFVFCPKFYQGITHRGKIDKDQKALVTKEFFDGVLKFGERLGPLFLTTPDSYNFDKSADLFSYLESLPSTLTIFAETRNESWFSSPARISIIAQQLNRINKGWVMTDTPGRRDALHLQLTIPKAFIRFVCMGDNELDRFRIQQWKLLLQDWIEQGLNECCFFLHVHNEKIAIEFAKYVQSQLRPLVK